VFPLQGHSLILGEDIDSNLKCLITSLTSLGIATLGNKPINTLFVANKVIASSTLKLKSLILRRVKLKLRF
jgi:hypothetical protein